MCFQDNQCTGSRVIGQNTPPPGDLISWRPAVECILLYKLFGTESSPYPLHTIHYTDEPHTRSDSEFKYVLVNFCHFFPAVILAIYRCGILRTNDPKPSLIPMLDRQVCIFRRDNLKAHCLRQPSSNVFILLLACRTSRAYAHAQIRGPRRGTTRAWACVFPLPTPCVRPRENKHARGIARLRQACDGSRLDTAEVTFHGLVGIVGTVVAVLGSWCTKIWTHCLLSSSRW